MKHSRKTCGNMRSKIVLTFSFVLGICALCFGAGPYAQLKQQFDGAPSDEYRKQLLEDFRPQADRELREEINAALQSDKSFVRERFSLATMIARRASAETSSSVNATDIEKKAKDIKSSPLYRDTGNISQSNWIGRAFTRVGEWLSKLFQNSNSDIRRPNVSPAGLNARIILWIVGGLLASLIIVFLVFVIRHVNWTRNLRRKATALLDEDEPDRSVDEWLKLAEALTQQGRFREAVRCLYLAILLRFDEANIARFIRSETNWEHLARIQGSPNRPAEIDFLGPTQAFDRIWYGQRVRGIEDVDQFRIWYGQTSKLLMGARA